MRAAFILLLAVALAGPATVPAIATWNVLLSGSTAGEGPLEPVVRLIFNTYNDLSHLFGLTLPGAWTYGSSLEAAP